MRCAAGLHAILLVAGCLLSPFPAVAQAPLEAAMQSVVSVLPVMPGGRFRAEEPEGSGVVVREGRHVVTALHVVEGAERIMVRSLDGEVIGASVLGLDRFTDLAVLEIEATFVPAAFADDPELGDRVCAIGNAFGLGLSVSCGIVSGIHKAGVGFNPVEDFVQTDAAVNPGASGGALIDAEGRVVGVLSAIFTKASDANIGVNFAVSAPLVKIVLSSLVETGAYHPPRTGLRLADDPAYGQPGRMAARVISVTPNSPGAEAGLRQGDRILFAGDRRVQRPADMVSAIARLAAPGVLVLEIERDGAEMSIELSISVADEPEVEALK